MSDQEQPSPSKTQEKLIVGNPLLPDYSQLKTHVKQQYRKVNGDGNVILPQVGNIINNKWQDQGVEEGLLLLMADLSRGGGVILNGISFESVEWRAVLREFFNKAATDENKKMPELANMPDKDLGLLIETVFEKFSVKAKKDNQIPLEYYFLESNKIALIKTAKEAAKKNKKPKDNPTHALNVAMRDAIVEVLLCRFMEDILVQCTSAPVSALALLAKQYDQNAIFGSASNVLRLRLAGNTTEQHLIHPIQNEGNLAIRYVIEDVETPYFELISRVHFEYGVPCETMVPIQGAIESTLILKPNADKTTVTLSESSCDNPNGLMARIYQGYFDDLLVGDEPNPTIIQAIQNEKEGNDVPFVLNQYFAAINSGKIPILNKALGGILIAVGIALGVAVLTIMVLTIVVLTGGAAAIPVVGAAIAGATSGFVGGGVVMTALAATVSGTVAVAIGTLGILAGYLGVEKSCQKAGYTIAEKALMLEIIKANQETDETSVTDESEENSFSDVHNMTPERIHSSEDSDTEEEYVQKKVRLDQSMPLSENPNIMLNQTPNNADGQQFCRSPVKNNSHEQIARSFSNSGYN